MQPYSGRDCHLLSDTGDSRFRCSSAGSPGTPTVHAHPFCCTYQDRSFQVSGHRRRQSSLFRPLTAPPPSYSPPGQAGCSTPRIALPPASGRPLFSCCRSCIGQARPLCAQTSRGQALRGGAAPSPAVLLSSGSRSRGTSPRSATPTTSAGGRRYGRAHPSPPGWRRSRGG